jgi:hypothetical protein
LFLPAGHLSVDPAFAAQDRTQADSPPLERLIGFADSAEALVTSAYACSSPGVCVRISTL